MEVQPRKPSRPTPATHDAPAWWVGLRFLSFREMLVVAIVIVGGMLAFRVFDEWRGPIQWIFRLTLIGLFLYFVGRSVWGWWKLRAAAIASKGSFLAIGFAVVGWLGVALAHGVASISDSNYVLIIVAPLAMMIGVLLGLGGLVAAGVGVATAATGLLRRGARPFILVASGLLAVVLNLGHVVQFWRVLEGH